MISGIYSDAKSKLRYSCSYCPKTYTRKDSLNRHIVLCEFNCKKICDGINARPIVSDIPNISELYSIVVDLSLKYDKLQAEYNKLSKWVQQKKRKINVVEWLNEKCDPGISHDEWLDKIALDRKHLNYVFNSDFVEGIIMIFQEFLIVDDCDYNGNNGNGNTIKAFDHKEGVFFVYDKIRVAGGSEGEGDEREVKWHIMNIEEFQKTIRCISLKIIAEFKKWQDENMDKMEDDAFSRNYIINFKKVMGNSDLHSQYNKIRNKLYKYLKIDLKNIMYDFE